MATGEDVRRLTRTLPRSSEHLIRDRPKFRVGAIVYAALSPDERTLGFAFPKEEREALVASEPHKFSLPRESDLRFNWVHGDMDALSVEELHELIVDAWLMVVPKKVGKAYLDSRLPGVTP
ncbi:MAG TPA: MmcQ/YjbR family DNA-binding protein [Umezawaea sp.]|nr:MmcQ/YjbR family DNA-binding protein [Umezawaea sp.]